MSGKLAHHFENPEQQLEAAKLGMWIFLATEVLFFGGLLCAYTVYRVNHPEVFVYAHQFLDKNLGALNTIVLICSSFTMAWAVRAAQLSQRRMLTLMLVLTMVFGFTFMGVKFVEYRHKWEHGLLWARQYQSQSEHHEGDEQARTTAAESPAASAEPEQSLLQPSPAAGKGEAAPPPNPDAPTIGPAPAGPQGLADQQPIQGEHELAEPALAKLFFSIYFLLTGLHGIHVLGGIGAMAWLLLRHRRGDFADGYATPVDMVGLYWHLVDLIWIYLFLLLYLIH